MKAAVCKQYGHPEVLKVEDVKQQLPKNKEVMIRIHATTVTQADVVLRSGMSKFPPMVRFIARLIFGIRKPRKTIQGRELAGEIEAIGKNVTRFKIGDKVIASPSFGAYGEYICLTEEPTSHFLLGPNIMVLKPDNLSYEEAAALPIGGLTALFYLRKVNIQKGQKMLIYGASGSVGTFAVQLAKYFGAEVTGVCSTTNLVLVKNLGADVVIDYTKDDYTKSGTLYDYIFDAVGKTSFSKCRELLYPNGSFLTVSQGVMKKSNEDLLFLADLMHLGKLKSVVDKSYPLEKIAEAHKYVEIGHKKGNIIISIGNNNETG
ncbi:NAD-dependent alcohol dehydrogenase [Candidatus Lokiarchaeum ossiferum]|uniref:NAD-dependent alcohol dehydrogenase n=1 Tax=Candidatus Lokiarchaeum ossiferum TaxID=2951803 RepID=A0ABY6HPX0_9ARCH|nr:NAD-dependent alcohol dehydrogenase [Candidatus Lokiarchaeum sp. B-35]